MELFVTKEEADACTEGVDKRFSCPKMPLYSDSEDSFTSKESYREFIVVVAGLSVVGLWDDLPPLDGICDAAPALDPRLLATACVDLTERIERPLECHHCAAAASTSSTLQALRPSIQHYLFSGHGGTMNERTKGLRTSFFVLQPPRSTVEPFAGRVKPHAPVGAAIQLSSMPFSGPLGSGVHFGDLAQVGPSQTATPGTEKTPLHTAAAQLLEVLMEAVRSQPSALKGDLQSPQPGVPSSLQNGNPVPQRMRGNSIAVPLWLAKQNHLALKTHPGTLDRAEALSATIVMNAAIARTCTVRRPMQEPRRPSLSLAATVGEHGGETQPLAPMACHAGTTSSATPAPFIALTIAACSTALNLESDTATSCSSVRLVVRWENHVRRQRFVHFLGLSVALILGRDFLALTGIVIDVASGGYRAGPSGPLQPFTTLPLAMAALQTLDAVRVKEERRPSAAAPLARVPHSTAEIGPLAGTAENALHCYGSQGSGYPSENPVKPQLGLLAAA
ncbi:hypothetical protein HPB49_008415 [Dermacentor silvarum]|uniref:Uncharacterized protein n=1 Tax=Dermacentor silvarum TaxID=543639 RepID=A0ACB8DNB6_DERSI|nr:hypothetical protein HPB49_008415 [Dermacentor silvarum]